MPLKLEVGKRYVTRDGRVTAPLDRDGFETYPFTDGDFCTWTEHGTVFHSKKDRDDLVAEVDIKILGIPDGYRAVRFGQVSVGDLWMGSCGSPLKFTHEVDNGFHALIVEKIETEE